MACNCGRKKKKKVPSPETTLNKAEVAMSDEEVDAVVNLMLNRVSFQDAVKEVGIKGKLKEIRNKVNKRIGRERMLMLRFLNRLEYITNGAFRTEDVELINAAIANCEDLLIRLKQRKVELT